MISVVGYELRKIVHASEHASHLPGQSKIRFIAFRKIRDELSTNTIS